MRNTVIIGVDCATESARIGLARGVATPAGARLADVVRCRRDTNIAVLVAAWAGGADRVLLAMDAPLGWPEQLGNSLATHRAGDELSAAADTLFHRATDDHVQRTYAKKPLEVGADRIARTAHAALRLLESIRLKTGHAVPLAWTPEFTQPIAAIEVYPAATLSALEWERAGYRKTIEGRETRRGLIDALCSEIALSCAADDMLDSTDALDAALCVVAGVHFLRGECIPPANNASAEREGWIWVKKPRETRPPG